MTTKTLLSASLVLVVATTSVLASHCSFNLTQTIDRVTTRVEVANQTATLRRDYNGAWLGVVRNASTVTTSDDTGTVEVISLSELSLEELAENQDPMEGYEMKGMRIVEDPTSHNLTVQSPGGAYMLETENADGSFTTLGDDYYSTFSDLMGNDAKEVNHLTKGVFSIETRGRNRFLNDDLYAIVNASDPSGFNHVMFFLPSSDNSPVILVDQFCSQVQIMPHHLLGPNMRGY